MMKAYKESRKDKKSPLFNTDTGWRFRRLSIYDGLFLKGRPASLLFRALASH